MRIRRLRRLAENVYAVFRVYIQLSVTILAVGLEVLADGNSLLDKHVEVLGNLRGEA